MLGAATLHRHRGLDRTETFDRVGPIGAEMRVDGDDAVTERNVLGPAVAARGVDGERHIREVLDLDEGPVLSAPLGAH